MTTFTPTITGQISYVRGYGNCNYNMSNAGIFILFDANDNYLGASDWMTEEFGDVLATWTQAPITLVAGTQYQMSVYNNNIHQSGNPLGHPCVNADYNLLSIQINSDNAQLPVDLSIDTLSDITSVSSTIAFLTGSYTINVSPYSIAQINATLYGGPTSATSTMINFYSFSLPLSNATSTATDFFISAGNLPNGYYQFRNVEIRYDDPDTQAIVRVPMPYCSTDICSSNWQDLISNVFQVNISENPIVNPIFNNTTSTLTIEPLGGLGGWFSDMMKYLFIPSYSGIDLSAQVNRFKDLVITKFPFKYFAQISGAITAQSIVSTDMSDDVVLTTPFGNMSILSVSSTKALTTSTAYNTFYGLMSVGIWFLFAMFVLGLWREFTAPKQGTLNL